MFQGKAKSFSKVSEFQDKWHVDPRETGARKGTEYRSELRNNARIAYRVAKKTLKQMEKQND
tara:strand:- start:419 stop:604 length:186 start_codon:yes stop_codon:yes gene_type:complete